MGLVTSSRGGSETRPAGHVAGLPGAGCPGSGSVVRDHEARDRTEPWALKASGKSRGRAPRGERVSQKGRAPRGRARQGVHQLAGRGPRYLPRAFRRSASLLFEAAVRENLWQTSGREQKRSARTMKIVIASEAKQSRAARSERAALDCFVAIAPRNDERAARTTIYFSPPAHARSAWWGGVGGGGHFLVRAFSLDAAKICRSFPPPLTPPRHSLARMGGGEQTGPRPRESFPLSPTRATNATLARPSPRQHREGVACPACR